MCVQGTELCQSCKARAGDRAYALHHIYIYARGTNSKSHPKCFDGVDGSPKRLKLSIISFSYRSAPSRRPSVIVVVVVRPSVRPSPHPHVRGLRAKMSADDIPYVRD